MKQAATLSVLAAVLLGLLTVVPAPAATAKPTSQCIYMVKNVRHYDRPPYRSFEAIKWEKTGNRIKGIRSAIPGPYERHRLVYKPAKNRAVGKKQNWITGRYDETMTFTVVGKGNKLRVKGYKRVSAHRIQALQNGVPLNQLPGSRCY